MLVRIFAILVLTISSTAKANVGGAFGTYVGTVFNQILKKDQLVKLELVPTRVEGGSIRLRGILTLQFGGFDSGEYISYHYHDIGFNLLTGVLTFNQTDQEVYISSASISGSTLTGELYVGTGLIGPIVVSSAQPGSPSHPLVEPLGGEYKGTCNKTPSRLQLFTFLSTEDTHRIGNLFGAYQVKGQLGKYDPLNCEKDKNKHCVYSKIESASYNFIDGSLILNGYPFSQTCKVDGDKIDCGECRFQRSSGEMDRPATSPVVYKIDPIEQIKAGLKRNPLVSLSGNYVGYVFHEQLGIYQQIQFEISTLRKGSNLFVNVATKLHFGSTEAITYRFDSIEFPNPLSKPQFVLARPEADVDAMIRVLDFRDGVIEGQWYSLIFGKVGSFVATQNGDLPGLSGTKLFGSVSGIFEESGPKDGVIVDLVVGQGSAPVGSDNPFYPLNLFGNVWWKSGVIKKEEIQGGSYDFYTGRITFIYGQDKLVSGVFTPGRPALFRRLGGGFGTLMQPFDLVQFDLRK